MGEKQLNMNGLGEASPCGDTHAAGAGERGPSSAAPGAIEPARPGGISAGAPGGVIARALPEGAASGTEIAPKRGKGRPPGATNIRDTETAKALVDQYGDPLEADVAIGNADLGGLVTLLRTIASDRGLKLGGTVMDIARWQADCRRNAMPYVRSKRAPVNEKGETVPPIIGLGRAEGAILGGRSIEDVVDAEVLADQGDSEAGGGQSHGRQSHGGDK